MALTKETLSDEALGVLLKELPEWAVEDGVLVRYWNFKDFVAAMAFVNRVAAMAEEAGHHPDVDIRYSKVKLGLVSHDAGGITAKDAKMARQLSAI